MLKSLFNYRRFWKQQLLLTLLFFLTSQIAWAEVPQADTVSSSVPEPNPVMLHSDVSSPDESVTSNDPLGSPHPIPWNWIMATYNKFAEEGQKSQIRYYRTPSLISPDGDYAAYSRIKMQSAEQFHSSRASSVMFVENLQTRELRVISSASPLADNPLKPKEEASQPGVIAVLIPVSWSANGNRVLGRQFEGLFSSSHASDFAVIWDRQQNQVSTVAPNQDISFTNAILLGWSQVNPDAVLFQAGNLGDENWDTWSVNFDGKTLLSQEDRPQIYGQTLTQLWSGPQARW